MHPMTQTPPRRAVLLDMPPSIEAWRRRTGADRCDEVWEGVLHMGPLPNFDHQDLEFHLEAWLRAHWAKRTRGRVSHQRNVAQPGRADWQHNYRGPDLVLVRPARLSRDRNEYIEGGPDVIIEIRSPGDESYDKLPFYFEVGVEEAWIVDRDTKVPELFVRGAKAFRRAKANRAGWLVSKVTGVQMRAAANDTLALRLGGDLATESLVPPDSSC